MALNLKKVLKSTQVSLEKKAVDKFGSAVEDFARSKIGLPGRSVSGTIPRSSEQQPKPGTWNATSYAAVLAGATPLRPKLKFLFKVQFIFNSEVLRQFPGEIARQLQQNTFTYMIKTVDRPKVDFEYEDDVNIYNYRTKVLKKIRHRELTLTFMDDVGNSVFDFFRTLMMIYSPITRDSADRDGNVSAVPDGRRFTDGNGMTFSSVADFARDDTAHRGVINSAAGNAIDLIRVKQIFIDPTNQPGNSEDTVQAIFYDFINPRLVSFDLDELSHESSDANLLTMQFDYDWLEMTKHQKLIDTGDGGPEQRVTLTKTEQNGDATGIPSDILRGFSVQEQNAATRPQNSGKGGGNPFANILVQSARKTAGELTSDLVNKGIKQLAGNGRFANSSLGRRVTGELQSITGNLAGSAGGLIVDAARDRIGGLFSTINQSTARASNPVVADSATVGADLAGKTSSSPIYDPVNPSPGGGS